MTRFNTVKILLNGAVAAIATMAMDGDGLLFVAWLIYLELAVKLPEER